MLHVPGLYIQDIPHKGRGVFCGHDLQEGDTIELCPVIIIPPSEVPSIHGTHLHDYYFCGLHLRERLVLHWAMDRYTITTEIRMLK